MTAKSYKVADNLFLVRKTVSDPASNVKPVDVSINHVFVTDCSGSMYGEIDKVRNHIKTKLPKLMKEGDTFTLIAFSGRGEFWRILTGEPVATLSDLTEVNRAIDRWLRPVGLTGFKDPLEDAVKAIGEIQKKNANPFYLTFMTDGYDNQWSQAEILKATEVVGAKVAGATFVEYGYYANRPLLTAMAEKSGGSLVFSEDFNRFAPQLDAVLQRRPAAGKRVEVKIEGDVIGGFAYAMVDGDLVTYSCAGGTATVTGGLQDLFYLSPTVVGLEEGDLSFADNAKLRLSNETKAAAYAALSLNAVRMNADVVFALLRATGDVAFIEQFANCFGKQKYSEFMEATKAATFDSNKRFTKGYDPNKVPRDDAFTVLDVISLLQEDESARVLLEHPDFVYRKIGRSRLDADDQLTTDEQAEIERLTDELKTTKDAKKVRELTDKIAAVTANKQAALKFVADPAPDGYAIDGLTFNEDRPNVSFRVRRPGKVDISARLPDQFKGDKIGKIPPIFTTHTYRNYAMIKDGIVNIDKMPVRVSKSTYDKFYAEGIVGKTTVTDKSDLYTVVLNLRELPVVNRKMVKVQSAKDFFSKKLELAKAKAAQKVYNAYVDEKLPERVSEGFVALYGDEGAKWLKEQGFSETNGFAPKSTTTAPATDKYTAKMLKTSLKGLSSLPKVAEVRDKIAKKAKQNAGGSLMVEAIQDVEKFLASDFYKKAGDKDQVLSTWLNDRKKTATAQCRQYMREIAQTTFITTVGQVWFKEFSSLDENSMTIKFNEVDYECKAQMLEYEEEI